MKNSKTSCHRSDKLDTLLQKYVEITFFDGEVARGYLTWDCGYETPYGYCLCRPNEDTDIGFKKSHVRKVVVINAP